MTGKPVISFRKGGILITELYTEVQLLSQYIVSILHHRHILKLRQTKQ
jgi:hypothetical protein